MKHNKYSFDSTFRASKPSEPLRPGATDYEHIISKDSGARGACSKASTQYYTGSLLIGIATLHKSNAVPITTYSNMAVEISRMRRG